MPRGVVYFQSAMLLALLIYFVEISFGVIENSATEEALMRSVFTFQSLNVLEVKTRRLHNFIISYRFIFSSFINL